MTLQAYDIKRLCDFCGLPWSDEQSARGRREGKRDQGRDGEGERGEGKRRREEEEAQKGKRERVSERIEDNTLAPGL